MTDLWFPQGYCGVQVYSDPAPRNLWGDIVVKNSCPKMCIHTTQSPMGLYKPKQGKYYGGTDWPHGTVYRLGPNELDKWGFASHIPVNYSARALKNTPGGVETNRANVFQVEIACKSEEIEQLPDEAYTVLAIVAKCLHEAVGLELQSTVTWKRYSPTPPSSYGLDNGVRIKSEQWYDYGGIIGHQHVPENDHGDPGAFNIVRLLDRVNQLPVNPTVPAPAPIVLKSDVGTALDAVMEKFREEVFSVSPLIKQPDVGSVLGMTYNKAGDLQSRMARLEELVRGIAQYQKSLLDVAASLEQKMTDIAAYIGYTNNNE